MQKLLRRASARKKGRGGRNDVEVSKAFFFPLWDLKSHSIFDFVHTFGQVSWWKEEKASRFFSSFFYSSSRLRKPICKQIGRLTPSVSFFPSTKKKGKLICMKDYGKGDDGKNDENENDAFSRFFPCLRFPLNELYNQNEMLSGGKKKLDYFSI